MKKSKQQIANSFTYELTEFGITHPHTLELIESWLKSKWHPAKQDQISIALDYAEWVKPTARWTEIGYEKIVIRNDPGRGFVIWLKGQKIHSYAIDQCWQDGLAKLKQAEINEIMGADSLFDIKDYERGSDNETGNIYTHEEG